MLNKFARAFATRLLTPIAAFFLKIGLKPDAVTWIGTIGACAGALYFFPRGEFVAGVLFIAVFVIFDLLDGTMARMSGQSSTWGAFLDSTLDRIADGAVFGGLMLYYARQPGEAVTTWATLACLIFGFVTSYARARAEGLGLTGANTGLAERADRLVVVLLVTFIVGLFDLPGEILAATLWLLALASAFTVGQRMLGVHREIRAGQKNG
ncbi:MAG: CDP-alcohol phosphatidyltransferase family protein [Dermatophilus congolensis]|nr:CDP-alcohol phosphatidyltransferase family protein [Dermatophilus congolensis]